MSNELLIIREYFDKLHERDRGLVTIVGLSDRIVAGVGDKAFLILEFREECINISARLPIQSDPFHLLPNDEKSDGRHRCIRLNKHRKKTNVRQTALLSGIDSETARGKVSGSVALYQWSDISFELVNPESIPASEYYANKIISIVRRKITLSGDNVFLKDYSDQTDLIELATREWRRNKPRFIRKQ